MTAFKTLAFHILHPFTPKPSAPRSLKLDEHLDRLVAYVGEKLKSQGYEPVKSMYAGIAFMDNETRAQGPMHGKIRFTTDLRKLVAPDTYSMLTVARSHDPLNKGTFYIAQVDVDAKTGAYKSQGRSVSYRHFVRKSHKPNFDAEQFIAKTLSREDKHALGVALRKMRKSGYDFAECHYVEEAFAQFGLPANEARRRWPFGKENENGTLNLVYLRGRTHQQNLAPESVVSFDVTAGCGPVHYSALKTMSFDAFLKAMAAPEADVEKIFASRHLTAAHAQPPSPV